MSNSFRSVLAVSVLDEPRGIVEKLEAHKKGVLHRAFSVFLTDENGNITGLGVDYCADEVKAGESCRRTVDIYQDSTILSYTKNILIFTSPTTLVEE